MVAFVNPLESVSTGQNWVNGLFTQQANRRAGAAVAGGDYRGGAGALLRSGDLRGGLALQEQGDQRAAAQKTEQDAAKAQQLQTTLQITRALRQVRDQGGDLATELPKYRETFLVMGTDPAQLSQIESQIAANPAFLDQVEAITGQQLQELEIINYGSGRGGAAVNKQTGQVVSEFGPQREPINVGGVLVDPDTYAPILDTREPKYQAVKNSDGSESLVAIDQPAPIIGGSRSSSGGGRTDINSILDGVIQREGGFVASDGRSGAPANFGINQRANPDIDVRNLDEAGARRIYQERYIKPIVDAGVSGPALEAVIDFGVNAGVGRSLDFWNRSGGDIEEFNRLRLAHYRSLPDYAQNGRSWERRVQETTPGQAGTEVSSAGGARVVARGENTGPQVRMLTADEKRERGLNEDTSYQIDQNERVTPIAGSGAEKFTEAQRNAAYFTYRLNNATRVLSSLAEQGVERPSPAVLAFAEGRIRENALSSTDRRWLQASREWLAPILRKDTGAAITLDEVVYYMGTYLANPTDDAATLRQKAQARRAAEEALRGLAGGAFNELYPQANAPTAGRSRLGFTPNEAQTALRRRIVPDGRPSNAPPGSARNPFIINPGTAAVSRNNVPAGGYFIDVDGRLKRKPA